MNQKGKLQLIAVLTFKKTIKQIILIIFKFAISSRMQLGGTIRKMRGFAQPSQNRTIHPSYPVRGNFP